MDGSWWAIETNLNGNTVTGWLSTAFTNPRNVFDIPTIDAPAEPDVIAPPVPPAGAASGTTLTTVNLRSGPSVNYPVLGTIPGGSVIELTGISSDRAWWQLRIPNTVNPDGYAWVFSEFLVAVNADNLPTASAPGTTVVITPPSGAQPERPAVAPVAVYVLAPQLNRSIFMMDLEKNTILLEHWQPAPLE